MTTAGVEQPAIADERAALRPELAWWKRTGPVAALTSILAATVPATTAVWGLIQKDREMAAKRADQDHEAAMAELKLKHSIQMDFLDRLKDDNERLRTLRMVEATNDDKRMTAWAKAEKEVIETPMRALQAQIEEQKKKADAQIEEQKKKADAAEAALQTALADSKTKASQIAELRTNAARQAKQLLVLQHQRPSADDQSDTAQPHVADKWRARAPKECEQFGGMCTRWAAIQNGPLDDRCLDIVRTCLKTTRAGQPFTLKLMSDGITLVTDPPFDRVEGDTITSN
jgi:hypothetical protein